jgi:hypothetical protein
MSWDDPLFDSPFERRRLRILNSLFLAAARMNGKPTLDAHPKFLGPLRSRAVVRSSPRKIFSTGQRTSDLDRPS